MSRPVTRLRGKERELQMAIEITMPAGEYYVGDPCYALSQDNRDKWHLQTIRGPGVEPLPQFTINGYKCLSFRTLEGDGLYPGSDGFEYGVDSGRIGLIPVPLLDPCEVGMGTVRTFNKPFACSRDPESGQLTFGDLVIETDV